MWSVTISTRRKGSASYKILATDVQQCFSAFIELHVRRSIEQLSLTKSITNQMNRKCNPNFMTQSGIEPS